MPSMECRTSSLATDSAAVSWSHACSVERGCMFFSVLALNYGLILTLSYDSLNYESIFKKNTDKHNKTMI